MCIITCAAFPPLYAMFQAIHERVRLSSRPTVERPAAGETKPAPPEHAAAE
jgi:hypothetical protein